MNLSTGFWEAAFFLEGGHLFTGQGFGYESVGGGEAIFNTGMTGYQEVFTDPSYSHQIVVMTGSHIGNTGVNLEDVESRGLFLKGIVVRDYCDVPSNWRSVETLSSYLKKHRIPMISDVDTREITQVLRDEGAQRGVVFPTKGVSDLLAHGKQAIESVPPMTGLELVSIVSTQSPYQFSEKGKEGTVVVYDFGVKTNILRHFAERDFRVLVVPYHTPAQEVLKEKPSAVILSNGPGDPEKVPGVVGEIQKLVGKIPLFAICMGHQLLARALGGTTHKLKFGHHGVNHPVQDLRTGRILITSQNHGFCVKLDGVDKSVEVTHRSLNDDTLEGFASEKMKFHSVQFHPEAKPGPSDADYLFDQFLKGFVR